MVVFADGDRYRNAMAIASTTAPASSTAATTMTDAELTRHLERTSRTFALAIPLLEPPLARQIGLAYLLLRVADTLEDAPCWGREARHTALISLSAWLGGETWLHGARDWQDAVAASLPTADAGCLTLLARADDVRSSILAMGEPAASVILGHVRRTTLGMASFVARQDARGLLVLQNRSELQAYTYVVAGIVGELLTDLFALAMPKLADMRGAFTQDAAAFGEGLQLVNILKDAPADAREGRSYLPPTLARAEVMALAREDLSRARRYIANLAEAQASPGVVRFCALPVLLASATLDALDRGESKLSRQEVSAIVSALLASDPASVAPAVTEPV